MRNAPQSALNFITQVAAYSNPHAALTELSQRDAIVRQLIESSARLNAVLDAQWQFKILVKRRATCEC